MNVLMNHEIELYANIYLDNYCSLFKVTNEGNLNTSEENIKNIEKWFNLTYLFVSLFTGLQLSEAKFKLELGIEHEYNQKILMHIYSVSYIGMQHFARILKREIPSEFTEKKALLQKRKEDKKEAQKEYNVLKKTLENNTDYDEAEKQDIINTMDQLKKQFVNVSKDKIEKIKALIRAYGATYYDAPGEADELCAMLVLKKIVWACLSEDMDMFVYGCSRVIRYFSLINHNFVLFR